MATVVCTPEHMEDLVLGFLASEGVIRHVEQVLDLQVSRWRGVARVRIQGKVNFNQAFYNKRYVASCCGKGRQMFYYYNDAHTAKRVEDPVRLQPCQVVRL
ncbi:MAG: formate dehydrogenase accessory sulfurtransferase FdhD, partial [Alicyclobacillus sp.]|nr:formate dehydrogenase accessory sulfurtransferase FdhD [Alicyclobacillus sp.]